jgi:hypothetical protein
MVWRVESGRGGGGGIQHGLRMLERMGAEASLDVREPFLIDGDRQRDAAHALLSSYVSRHFARSGWQVAQEVEIGRARTRGWIDVFAFHPVAEVAVAGELKTDLRDLGQAQRQVEWHEREAWSAARALGWRPRLIRSALFLLATERNDARVLENGELLRQAFPVRASSFNAWIRDPSHVRPPSGRALAMIDPLCRRRVWLRPTRSDGRRSTAKDTDYAGFMRRWRERRERRLTR